MCPGVLKKMEDFIADIKTQEQANVLLTMSVLLLRAEDVAFDVNVYLMYTLKQYLQATWISPYISFVAW